MRDGPHAGIVFEAIENELSKREDKMAKEKLKWFDICKVVEIGEEDKDYDSPHRQDLVGKRVMVVEASEQRENGFISCDVVLQEKTEHFRVGVDLTFSAVKLEKIK